ncbi:MAG: hypothetical protein ABJG15_04175 [Hyphomonadaceae bacterium]
MKRYLLFAAVLAFGITIGAVFQQLRIDEQRVFWLNSLTRYNLMATAYRDICLPLEELESAVEEIGLEPRVISQSGDTRANLVFVQTGAVEPFTKDLGNMKFHLNGTNTCVTVRQGK